MSRSDFDRAETDILLKDSKFSVLMSVYNKEKPERLRVAMDSIINQTVQPTEIILVKDGPLNSRLDSVIDYYLNNCTFLRVVELKKNVGLGRSLNEGMRHCRYEIVARMDTDDCSMCDRFEKQLLILTNNPEIDIVGSNVYEYDEDMNELLSTRSVPKDDQEIKKYLKKRNPFNHMSVMYRKKKVTEAGGYIDCPFFEDYYLWCRMAKTGSIFHNIQDPLVKVRAGTNMIDRRGGIAYAKNAIGFERKVLQLHIIGLPEFCYNSFVRTIVALFPHGLRRLFYSRVLRKDENQVLSIREVLKR